MNPSDVLARALSQPPSLLLYALRRELAALRPGKVLLYTEDSSFDVDEYHRAGLCRRSALDDSTPLFQAFRDEHQRTYHRAADTWHAVEWQSEHFEVVVLTWFDGEYEHRASFVLADSLALAERFYETVSAWNDATHGEVLVLQGGCFFKSDELYGDIQRASFDTLVLPGDLKQQIRSDLARFFSSRELYQAHGVPWKRGLLFIGPPGNGKTHTLRALIRECARPCLYVKDFKGGCESEGQNIAKAFARVRELAPAVLIIEDIDCHVLEHNRSVFLNELDGFAANAGVVVLASTNHPEKLDRSVLDRPSRFDRKFHFPLPELGERRAYLAQWNASVQPALRASDRTLDRAAERSHGFTFAYLKELTLSSMMAFMADPRPGAMDAVMDAVLEGLHGEMDSARVFLPAQPSGRRISLASDGR